MFCLKFETFVSFHGVIHGVIHGVWDEMFVGFQFQDSNKKKRSKNSRTRNIDAAIK